MERETETGTIDLSDDKSDNHIEKHKVSGHKKGKSSKISLRNEDTDSIEKKLKKAANSISIEGEEELDS